MNFIVTTWRTSIKQKKTVISMLHCATRDALYVRMSYSIQAWVTMHSCPLLLQRSPGEFHTIRAHLNSMFGRYWINVWLTFWISLFDITVHCSLISSLSYNLLVSFLLLLFFNNKILHKFFGGFEIVTYE